MANANATTEAPDDGQFLALAISNFVPDLKQQQLPSDCSTLACSSAAACASSAAIRPMPIFVGDYLRVLCANGPWCYGHRANGFDAKTTPATNGQRRRHRFGQQQQKLGQQWGLFPRSHVRPLGQKRKKSSKMENNNRSGASFRENDEAAEMVAEITETAKTWWEWTKSFFGAVNSSKPSCEEHICRIRELMALRRRLRSGTVPTEELRELRLGIARLLDVGNAALHLPMNIRDNSGRTIATDGLSVIASYKLHEEANGRIAAQQQQQQQLDGGGQEQLQEKHSSPPTVSPLSVETDTVGQSVGKLLAKQQQQKQAILLIIDHPQQQIASGTVELVLGLGQKAKGSTHPISEPLTIFLGRKMAADCTSNRQSRALFVGLSENELANEHNGLTLWATALRVGPLPGTGTLGKSTAVGEEVRQFYAHGHVDVGELCRDMAEKEQREFTLTLHKKTDSPLPAFCRQFPAGSSAAVPYPATASIGTSGGVAASANAAGDTKICLKGTVQRLSRAETAAAACKGVQSLHVLKSSDECCCVCAEDTTTDGRFLARRNEVFLWLRSADLHGIGKSEKTVEASISVVDDEGVFQPEAIEIVTPEGVRHQSTFRCRVWFSEDRPKLNELIKVRLPKSEMRNIHLQILFYNKLAGNEKKLLSANSSGGPGGAKGPFALAFLRLINNFVLCEEEEDELVVYKVEKRQTPSSGGTKVPNESGGTRPISVAYLAQWATRKEMLLRPRALSSATGGGGTGGADTASRHELSAQFVGVGSANGGGGPYTLQNDKNNGVQFVSFVNSMLHTTNPILLQILRWKNNGQQLLSQRLHEFCLALDDQRRHDGMVKELRKFLRNVLDALFQIADAMTPLQRNVFDALAYICHFCGQLALFKIDLEPYIHCAHSPKAFAFILHHIVWYIESEGSDALCVSSSSAAFHDKLMTILNALNSLVQLAIASKRCAELIRDSSREEQQQDDVNKEFKQYMDKVLAAIRRLLMGPGRRVTCQNLAMRHLASSILGPMASVEGIYEPSELAKYAAEVLDSLSEGVLMSQRLHFIGELIETKLFAIAECRSLLLCRCLDELVSLMPPHARDEAPCGGGITHFMDRSRSRSECSAGTAIASGDDGSSSSNITLLESVQQSAQILAKLVERLFSTKSKNLAKGSGTFDELQLVLRKCFRPLNQTMVTLLGDPTHQRTLHALLLGLLDTFSAEHFDAYFRSLSNQLERLDTLSEMLHMFRDLLVRCPVPAEWQSLRRVQLRLFAKHLRMAAALCQRDFGTPSHFDAVIWCECILSCVALAKCCAAETATKVPKATATSSDETEAIGTTQNDDEEEEEEDDLCDQQNEKAEAVEQRLKKYATEILRALWFSLVPESKCELMPHITGPLLEVGSNLA